MNELTLGDVTVTRIEEMHGPIMPPGQFFPQMPAAAWREHRETLVPDHLGADDGMVRGAFQTWLLRSGGRIILIDTGIGNDKSRPAVPLWDHLKSDYLGNPARVERRSGSARRRHPAHPVLMVRPFWPAACLMSEATAWGSDTYTASFARTGAKDRVPEIPFVPNRQV